MSYRREFVIEKSTGEVRDFTVPFGPEDSTLPAPAVSSAVVTARDERTGVDKTADVIISGNTVCSGNEVTFRVRNGENRKNYKISVQANLANGQIWICDGLLKINNP